MSDVPFKNPGWAGNTGEFDLTEEQVRGDDFVGVRPEDGGHASGAGTMPYMLADKNAGRTALRGRVSGALREDPHPVSDETGGAASDARGSPRSCAATSARSRWIASPSCSDLSPAYVRGVATFYTMYNKRPVGRHLVQVCTNISCNLAVRTKWSRPFSATRTRSSGRPPRTATSR